jgi:hypothetical protein
LEDNGIKDENLTLTGAWLQCVVDKEIHLISGSLKIFREDGSFSIYQSSTGKEWTNGTIDSLTHDSYIENVAEQTGSAFAGKSVPIKYTIEKMNSNIILKAQYYHSATGRWIPEDYVKIPDAEAEKIINKGNK